MDAERRKLWPRMILACAIAGALVYVHAGPAFSKRTFDATVRDIKPYILSRFVTPVDERKLDYAAVRGMVESLKDPFSSFMTPEEAQAFYDDTDREYGGLGMEITVRDGHVIVIAPLEDTPAFRAGILPGDRIIEVDGRPCAYRSGQEAAKDLKGPPGTSVRLTVLRRGATSTAGEDIEIVRAHIKVKSVRRPVMEDPEARIGYLRITNFTRETPGELKEALATLDAEGARAFVLDLRNNPGGYLQAAVATIDLFLAEGKILETRGREDTRIYEATADGTRPRQPMALLINGATVSAAEVVAGALKDNGVVALIGTRTYGKAAVQEVKHLKDGSVLKLTTSYYYTRSGRRIHRPEGASETDEWGIHPDVEVDLDAAKLQAILYRRSELEYEARNGNGDGRSTGSGDAPRPRPPAEWTDPQGAVPVDTQLQAALAHLRQKLASE